jgi:hypothetical protein
MVHSWLAHRRWERERIVDLPDERQHPLEASICTRLGTATLATLPTARRTATQRTLARCDTARAGAFTRTVLDRPAIHVPAVRNSHA